MDHLAAAEHRVRRVEDLGRPVEAARRCRAEHLVPAERQEVAAERGHVDRDDAARAVPHPPPRSAPDRVRGVDELPEGRDRTERVRHAGDRQDLRPLGEQRAEVGQVQLPVIGERDVAERRAGDGGGHLPRDDVGVMLHVGEQHLVALMEELPPPALCDQVHGFGGAAGEHDVLGTGRAEEPREVRARALEQLGRLLAQHVEATMGVRVVVRVEVGLRVDHLLRLLGRRGAVQVDHRPIAHRAREDREVLADLLDVQPSDVPRHVRLRIKPRRSRPLPTPARRGHLRIPWPRAPSRARDRRSSRYDPSSSREPCRA